MSFNHRDEHMDDGMLLIQANLDDMNPEWVSYIMDKLFDVRCKRCIYGTDYYEKRQARHYVECAG